MSYRQRLLSFLSIDEETRLRPLNSIEYRAQLLENIEKEFAIIPRDGVWLSPVEGRELANLSEADIRILGEWDALRQSSVATMQRRERLQAASCWTLSGTPPT
jgi:hypothetical protein